MPTMRKEARPKPTAIQCSSCSGSGLGLGLGFGFGFGFGFGLGLGLGLGFGLGLGLASLGERVGGDDERGEVLEARELRRERCEHAVVHLDAQLEEADAVPQRHI